MNICNNNHDEIVYDLSYCPFCESIEKISKLEDEIDKYHDTIASLESEIEELKNNI